MNVKTKASILLTLLTLSACQPDSGGSNPVTVPKHAPQETPQPSPGEIITHEKVITAEGIEITLSKDSDAYSWEKENEREAFLRSLNKYTVKIRIPVEIVKVVRLLKVDLNTDSEQSFLPADADLVEGKFEWLQQEVFDPYSYASKKVAYRVETAKGLLIDTHFEILPDLLVEGKKSASDIKLHAGSYRFANIVLTKEAVLKKQNLRLKLAAKNMYADHAQIVTFAENESPAEMGLPGLDGNTLEIEVSRIEGDITFKMYGQKGGQGYAGLDNSNAPKGKDGVAGSAAELKYFPSPPSGSGAAGLNIPPMCKKKPTNGTAGENGVSGGDGYEGAKGGDSGRVVLIYDQAENFTSNVIAKAGKGGDGGIGGAGGLPGKGGAAGAPPRKHAKLCPVASKGADGKPGAQGALGKTGEPGNKQPSCISQKNETILCQ